MSSDKLYRVAILIVSDRVSRGEREDKSVDIIRRKLADFPVGEIAADIVAYEEQEIAARLEKLAADGFDLILTSGGTGFGPRDVTPEATMAVIDREAPGLAEAIRAYSMQFTGRAMLGRGRAGLLGSALIINLPGSPKAVAESLDAILAQLEHALQMLAGGDH